MSVLRTATTSDAYALSVLCVRVAEEPSVLPKNRLPYISLNTTIVESEFDAGVGASMGGASYNLVGVASYSLISLVFGVIVRQT
jgi:hypothetical protein